MLTKNENRPAIIKSVLTDHVVGWTCIWLSLALALLLMMWILTGCFPEYSTDSNPYSVRVYDTSTNTTPVYVQIIGFDTDNGTITLTARVMEGNVTDITGIIAGDGSVLYHIDIPDGGLIGATSPTISSPQINGTVTTSGLTIPAFNAGGIIYLNSGVNLIGDDTNTWSAGSVYVNRQYLMIKETAGAPSGSTDKAIIYADKSGGLTNLNAKFQDDTVIVFAQETTPLDAGQFRYPSGTEVKLEMRKPHPGLIQYGYLFPDGYFQVMRAIEYHDAEKIAANQGCESPLPVDWDISTQAERDARENK